MIPLQIPGIANGYIVEPGVWRGAQPDKDAWQALYLRGCRAVIDLNTTGRENIAAQGELIAAAQMVYFPRQWSGILPPSQQQIQEALDILDVYSPVFIHCQHGSDRTGTLCACWRIHHDGWDFGKAMQEAFFDLGTQGEHEFWMAAAVEQYAHDQGKE